MHNITQNFLLISTGLLAASIALLSIHMKNIEAGGEFCFEVLGFGWSPVFTTAVLGILAITVTGICLERIIDRSKSNTSRQSSQSH